MFVKSGALVNQWAREKHISFQDVETVYVKKKKLKRKHIFFFAQNVGKYMFLVFSMIFVRKQSFCDFPLPISKRSLTFCFHFLSPHPRSSPPILELQATVKRPPILTKSKLLKCADFGGLDRGCSALRFFSSLWSAKNLNMHLWSQDVFFREILKTTLLATFSRRLHRRISFSKKAMTLYTLMKRKKAFQRF